MSLTYKRELITPQRARQMLDTNSENNRNPRSTKITQYARDMQSGNWNSNTGETIKVDIKGYVIDGQNRLAAVMAAGVDIYMDVVYDVPTEAMQVIDTGAVRTAGDALRISGAVSRTVSSAVVRWAILWDARLYTGQGGTFSPTITEIGQRYLAEMDRFDASARRGADCRRHGVGTGSVAGMAHYLFSRLDSEMTHQFYDQLITGANLPKTHPVLALRNKMGLVRQEKTTRPQQLALYVRSWNAFREDRTLDRMMIVRKGELNNANFPMPA
jgi:hypothetical protein